MHDSKAEVKFRDEIENEWISRLSELEVIQESLRLELEVFKNGDSYREMQLVNETTAKEIKDLKFAHDNLESDFYSLKMSEERALFDLKVQFC